MALKRRFRWEMLEQAVLAKNVAGGEDFPRWFVGDGVALVAALKRERERRGRMRGDWLGVRGRGIYRLRASRFVPTITIARPDHRKPNLATRVQG
jgi:hypothetical protein